MALAPGDRFGSYEITELVGVGGMGEVYRARDTRLQRDVALKVLTESRQLDPEFSRRLGREALLLASVNHPNIATLHGIETSGDVQALVMELVDGETLDERLARAARNGLPIKETLHIARQIVDALDAAHERGVVHRDLKPANIKVRSDGTVKLLDFGVAKPLIAGHYDPSGPTIVATHVGVIIGTPSYMSPEQASGGAVDKRADIWAFGCLLYEMLTGRRAFEGGTGSDTFACVMAKEPEWQTLPPDVPPSLKRLLRHCLEKDPKRRLRDIADVRFAIEESAADPGHTVTPPRVASRFGRFWLVAGPILLVAAVIAGWWAVRQNATVAVPPTENPLAQAQFTRFTDFAGSEWDADISRDGKFVTFLSDRDGPWDVWLSQVGTGRFTNLTQSRETTGDMTVRNMGISYDGSEIWLAGRFQVGFEDRRMRLMPLIGGESRRFLQGPVIHVTWSPDGAFIAYHTGEPGDPIFVAERTGANATQIFVNSSPGGHNHFPAWSPDGRWIYFVSGYYETRDMDLWRIAPEGGAPERLTDHHNDVTYPTPIDSRTVLYLSPAEDGSGPWLWAFDTERRIATRVSSGLEKYRSLAATADGRRLVATVTNPAASLWSVPILDRPVEEGDVRPYRVPTVRALAPRFGGGSLFYLSSLGTGDGLWRYTAEGEQASEIWHGKDGALLWPAGVSTDGTRAAIALRGGDKIQLHVISADGTGLNRLGDTIDVRGSASWSPDDDWIVTAGVEASGAGLFKIPVAGGAPVRLVEGPAADPVWSPAGNLIVYKGAGVNADSPLLAVRPDGTPVELPEIQLRRGGQRYRFLPNGEGLVYMRGSGFLAQDFWLLDLGTGQSRPLTRLRDTGEMRTFDVAPDGERIVFDRLQDNSDIVLIDLPE